MVGQEGHVAIHMGGKQQPGEALVSYGNSVTSPPDNLNNSLLLGSSQSNFSLVPYGKSGSGGSGGGKLAKKIPNKNGAATPIGRKPITLSHLPQRAPVDIDFSNLTYSVPEGRKRGYKTILKCVSGKFRSGELSAIMGPSGAGKSTLMNILAGYTLSSRRLTGVVAVNGKERNLRRFRKLSAYIMQDDQLLPHLSVREAMSVSANLKLGRGMKEKEKRVIIDEILEALGLFDSAETMTSSLSGGQRKRLSIALELVNNPPVMFFDEPTSGLDSSSCFQCICLLESLSRGGRTIICTIHQPSARVFEKFDGLYVLAEGQSIYRGPTRGLVPFLSSMDLECPSYHNPADFVIEVACGEHGSYVEQLVMAVNGGQCSPCSAAAKTDRNTNHPNEMKVMTGNGGVDGVVTCQTTLLDSDESLDKSRHKVGFPTSSWVQFYILLKRTFISVFRDQTLTLMRLISHILVGLLIGMIYFNIGNDASKVYNNSGCIFVMLLFLMFTAMMPTILTFPTEKTVFVREHLNYWYSLKAFYFAKTSADVPFQVVFSMIYITIVYYMSGQPFEVMRFLMVSLMCVFTSLISQSIGLLIGAAMRVENGVFIGPVASVPFILFSGFFVTFDTIPPYLHWLTYISFVRFAFEGIMIATYGFDRARLGCSEDFCMYRDPVKYLKQFQMEHASFWVNCLALLAILIVVRGASYIVLRWNTSVKR